MSDDVIATVKRFATDYRRGSHTDTEFVDLIVRTLVDHNASEDIVDQTLVLIPDSAIPALEERMHEMVERDFYLPNGYVGDTRSDEEIRRDSYARQPVLKRIHHTIIRSLLIRRSLR